MTTMAFFGSSLLSSYWNGAATYYRGIIRALAARGVQVTFLEPDVWDRQKNRDMAPPDWCRVDVWEGSAEGLRRAASQAAAADVVVVASGIGYEDDALRRAVLEQARPGAVRIWWDVDAPATLADMRKDAAHPLRRDLPGFDMVFTYGGGQPVIDGYRAMGARDCVPIYNALDPATHFPVPPDPRFTADLAFLGNRLPDRDVRVAEFLLHPARMLPEFDFLLGGSGWDGCRLPDNLRAIGHVGTGAHNAFNVTPRAILNIARDSMASCGFSPATRVFEAAGAGACLITDAWEGIEMFLTPGTEVLVARDGQDVTEILTTLTAADAHRIGEAARAHISTTHTYQNRAEQVVHRLAELQQRELQP
ncbi:MAG: glycosyltransferase [Rhodobacterales bacterium]|nr:glycosyltransferase [Rhodobacterales bacterium]MDX5414510.1 glycosyltransferase [Rhodobacterales bacterium]